MMSWLIMFVIYVIIVIYSVIVITKQQDEINKLRKRSAKYKLKLEAVRNHVEELKNDIE